MNRCVGDGSRGRGADLPSSFDAFRDEAIAAGCDEVLQREWQPDTRTGTQDHPFDAEAVVVRGELWLTEGGRTRHLARRGTFRIPAGTPHAERYGAEGATVRVGRRHATAA